MTTYVFFTSTNTNWNPGSAGLSVGNTISPEALGGGGGSCNKNTQNGGAAGGAWATPTGTTYTLVTGDLSAPFMSITVGAAGAGQASQPGNNGGTTTWANAAGTTLCSATGGSGDAGGGVAGGTVAVGIGNAGGTSGFAPHDGGAGGGGAGGPGGVGGAGGNGGNDVAESTPGGGGGGANGQAAGSNGVDASGGAGGTGGGSTGGTGGNGGLGGATTPGAGANGIQATGVWDGTHGPSGGGGGSGGAGSAGSTGLSQSAGTASYGGGAGGSGSDTSGDTTTAGASGGPGLGIVSFSTGASQGNAVGVQAAGIVGTPAGPPIPTPVQGNLTFDISGTTFTSWTTTLSAPYTSPHLLCGAVLWGTDTASDLVSVVTDKGDVATIPDKTTTTGQLTGYASYYFPTATSGAISVTANFAGARPDLAVLVDEFSGVSSTLDGHTGQHVNNTAGADGGTSGTFTTVTDGCLLYGSQINTSGTSHPVTAGVGQQWDSTQKPTNATLSGNNLITTLGAAAGGTDQCGRASIGFSTGKFYYEAAMFVGSQGGVGIYDSTVAANGTFGADNHGLRLNRTGGIIFGGVADNSGTFVNGDRLSLAVDIGALKFWWRKNGGAWLPSGDPAAGTGGFSISGMTAPVYPAYLLFNNSESVQMFPNSSVWSFAAPTGFTAWGTGFTLTEIVLSDMSGEYGIQTTHSTSTQAMFSYANTGDVQIVAMAFRPLSAGALPSTAAVANPQATPTGVSGIGSAGIAKTALTFAPTGVTATGRAGTASTALATTAVGVSGRSLVGVVSITASGNALPSGVSANGIAGTLLVSQVLSGVSAIGAAGTPTLQISNNITVSGVSGSAVVGTALASISKPVTGVLATGSAGTVGTPLLLAGVAARGSAGTVSVTISSSVSIVGVNGSGALGTVTVTIVTLSQPLIGVGTTAIVGSVTATTSGISLGVQANGSADTPSLTISSNSPLSGVVASGTAGTASDRIDATVSGATASGSIGVQTTSIAVQLSGVGAIGAAATPLFAVSRQYMLPGGFYIETGTRQVATPFVTDIGFIDETAGTTAPSVPGIILAGVAPKLNIVGAPATVDVRSSKLASVGILTISSGNQQKIIQTERAGHATLTLTSPPNSGIRANQIGLVGHLVITTPAANKVNLVVKPLSGTLSISPKIGSNVVTVHAGRAVLVITTGSVQQVLGSLAKLSGTATVVHVVNIPTSRTGASVAGSGAIAHRLNAPQDAAVVTMSGAALTLHPGAAAYVATGGLIASGAGITIQFAYTLPLIWITPSGLVATIEQNQDVSLLLPPLQAIDPNAIAAGLPPTFSLVFTLLNGSLPRGVTLRTDGSFSGAAFQIGNADPLTYNFTVRVSDGVFVADHGFSIIVNPFLTIDDWLIGQFIGTLTTPILNYSMGEFVTIGSAFDFTFDLTNVHRDVVNLNFSSVPALPSSAFNGNFPPGLSYDAGTRTIFGVVTGNNTIIGTYYLTVTATDVEGRLIMPPIVVSITVLPAALNPTAVPMTIRWITPSNLGLVRETTPCFFTVVAQASPINEVKYGIAPDSLALPPGIAIDSTTGQLVGTFNTVTVDTTYSFTLRAQTQNLFTDRTFTITIEQIFDDNFIEVASTVTGPDAIAWKTTYAGAIPSSALFRPQDSNFGLRDPNLYILKGLKGVTTDQFKITIYGRKDADPLALHDYHHRFDLIVSNYKLAFARDSQQNIVYEVIYRELVDPNVRAGGFQVIGSNIVERPVPYKEKLSNPSIPFVFPNSLNNIRDDLAADIGMAGVLVDQIGIGSNEDMPQWMLSLQDPNDGDSALGYVPALEIAYVQPGLGQTILSSLDQSFWQGKVLGFEHYIVFGLFQSDTTFDGGTTFDLTTTFDLQLLEQGKYYKLPELSK